MDENKKIEKKELFFLCLLITFFLLVTFKFFFIQPCDFENKMIRIITAIQNGSVPYKNFYDNTPPLNYYMYLTAYKIFNLSPDYCNLRTFASAYVIFFILLIYIIGRLTAGQTAAMLTSFFYVIFMSTNNYNCIYSLPGLFAQFPIFLCLMFLFFTEKGYEKVDYFLSGFFLCVASYAVFHVKFLVFIPIIHICLMWKKPGDKLKFVTFFLSGFIFMELLAVLWAVKNSALREFIRMYFVNNFTVFFNGDNLIKNINEIAAYKYYLTLMIFVSLYCVYKSLSGRKYLYNLTLSLTAITTGIIAAFQKSTDNGYFYFLIPFISLMSAVFIKDAAALVFNFGKTKIRKT
ncbi:MAG TPA: hypothetical protein PLF61_02075 [Candidatus Goldiibacteriota bacterium]|nr:hypothetical protein [Candidatus Goldiibacteriota bacterium]